MQLTPEQINTLISGILIIISGIVVGIFTIIGGVINNSLQRNQEKIKYRKEIFEVRFSQAETFITETLVLIHKLNYKLGPKTPKDQIMDEFEKILDNVYNNMYLTGGLKVSYDRGIINGIKNFMNLVQKFHTTLVDYLKTNDNKKLNDIKETIVPELVDAHITLKQSIDAFRLNDYKPIKIKKIP